MRPIQQILAITLLAAAPVWPQAPKPVAPQKTILTIEQPDAEQVKNELSSLLDRYPPSLRGVLALQPNLLTNESYLTPYPALASFLEAHPDVARNPSFYIGEAGPGFGRRDSASQLFDIWRDLMAGLAALAGFGMGIGLLVWLIRTLVDYKRWSRLARVQNEAHAKILDRLTSNEDLMAYIQSSAGTRYLQSSPIALDAAPRMGAPLSRILWAVQGGVVLMALGTGLRIVSDRVGEPASQSLHALGILAIALGVGFLLSALVSYAISRRLGLIEAPTRA